MNTERSITLVFTSGVTLALPEAQLAQCTTLTELCDEKDASEMKRVNVPLHVTDTEAELFKAVLKGPECLHNMELDAVLCICNLADWLGAQQVCNSIVGCVAHGTALPSSPLMSTAATKSKSDTTVRGTPIGTPMSLNMPVACLCVLPDGRVVVAATCDPSGVRSPQVWNPVTGERVAELRDPDNTHVLGMTVLPDGRLACATSRCMRLWDMTTYTCVAALVGKDARMDLLLLQAPVVLTDGRLVAKGRDGVLTLWDPVAAVCTGTVDTSQTCMPYWPTVASLPNCHLALVRGEAVHVWDMVRSERVQCLAASESVASLAALPGGRLAAGTCGFDIWVWNVGTGEPVATLRNDACGVYALAALPDGRVAAAAGGTVQLWDVATGVSTATLVGHTSCIWGALGVLPSGSIVSSGDDGLLLVHAPEYHRDPHLTKLVERAKGAALPCTTIPTELGPVMTLNADWDGSLVCGGMFEWRCWSGRVWGPSHPCFVRAVAIVDCEWVACVEGTEVIYLWHCTSCASKQIQATGNLGTLCALESGSLVAGDSSGTITLWSVQTAALVAQFCGHTQRVQALVKTAPWSFASGSSDATIRLWRTSQTTSVATLPASSSVHALAALLDTKLAAVLDTSVDIWDLASETCIRTICTGGYTPTTATALPGDCLAVALSSGAIELWDVTTGVCTQTLRGHRAKVNALTVLADGRLASGSSDGSIKLWPILTPPEHKLAVMLALGVPKWCVVRVLLEHTPGPSTVSGAMPDL